MISTRLSHRVAGAVLAAALVGSAGAAVLPGPTAGAAAATVVVTTTPNPSTHGQAVAVKAKITDPATPTAALAGTVSFYDGANLLGSTGTITSGAATLRTKVLDAGDHVLTASFAPSGGGATLTSNAVTQTVLVASTTTTLVSTRPSADYGAAGALVATVKPVAPGAGVPTGSVDFSIDGGWYWSQPLDATGKAKLALADVYPAFMAGPHTVQASYSGDVNNGVSSSATITQTLVGITEPPVTTITLNANGLPVFSPRSFTMSSVNPVGCNVTILNNTPNALALAYGTPGNWKRLPFGGIAPGAAKGIGVGLAGYTGYFTTTANTANYVAIHCV